MNKPRISIIVAIDNKRGIGKNNDLLFRISEDFKRMKEKTSGHPIILGRKTFESIGRVLPNRTNIIITRDASFKVDGAIVVSSLEEAIETAEREENSSLRGRMTKQSQTVLKMEKDRHASLAMTKNVEEIFIFGGGQVFKEALDKDLVDRIYLTIVKGDYHADTFFPDYESFGFKPIKPEITRNADGYQYTFLTLDK